MAGCPDFQCNLFTARSSGVFSMRQAEAATASMEAVNQSRPSTDGDCCWPHAADNGMDDVAALGVGVLSIKKVQSFQALLLATYRSLRKCVSVNSAWYCCATQPVNPA